MTRTGSEHTPYSARVPFGWLHGFEHEVQPPLFKAKSNRPQLPSIPLRPPNARNPLCAPLPPSRSASGSLGFHTNFPSASSSFPRRFASSLQLEGARLWLRATAAQPSLLSHPASPSISAPQSCQLASGGGVRAPCSRTKGMPKAVRLAESGREGASCRWNLRKREDGKDQ